MSQKESEWDRSIKEVADELKDLKISSLCATTTEKKNH